MTFRTTLYRALAAADVAYCNGRRVEAKLIDDDALLAPYVTVEDGASFAILDAEITIDPAGRAYSVAEDGKALVWNFYCMQAMTPACVEVIAPAAPTAAQVVERLRLIRPPGRRRS